jgi:hypothetical protein
MEIGVLKKALFNKLWARRIKTRCEEELPQSKYRFTCVPCR